MRRSHREPVKGSSKRLWEEKEGDSREGWPDGRRDIRHLHFSVGLRRGGHDKRHAFLAVRRPGGRIRHRLGRRLPVHRDQEPFAVQILVSPHAPRLDVRHAPLAVSFHRLGVQQHPIAVVVADLPWWRSWKEKRKQNQNQNNVMWSSPDSR